MVRHITLVVAFVLMSVVAYAQEVIEPGEAVQLRWDYPELLLVTRPVQFKVYTDTFPKTLTPADVDIVTANGVRSYTTKVGVIPPWTVAQIGITHSYSLTAFDSGGESAITANTISFIVKWNTAPPPPSGFKRFKVPTTLDFNPTTGEMRLQFIPVVSTPSTPTPQPLIGQGGVTPTVSDYVNQLPSEGPYFGFAREVKGLSTAGAASWKVAGYFAAETGMRGDAVYPLNVVVQRNSGTPKADAIGLEVNVNNNHSDLVLNEDHWLNGVAVASGGLFHPGVGVHIGHTSVANSFITGLRIDAAKTVTLDMAQSADGEGVLIRRNNDTNYNGWALRFTTADKSGTLFGIDFDGNLWVRGSKICCQ